ncbi:MAG: hypothetical protein II063_08930 [Prevotella sp.]|nr:hypothetical protein [Prevotella sp.]
MMYEGGNTTEEVVAKGEKEVVKDEVLPTSNLQDCAQRITSSVRISPSSFTFSVEDVSILTHPQQRSYMRC